MNDTPRVNQWWNAYRSGAINAEQFKEAIQGMERELQTCCKNYGKISVAHETIMARLLQAENTIRYANHPVRG
jgi:hypothetical protein